MNVITDYDQFFRRIVTKIHIGPIFSQDTEHSDKKFFRHTNQEKIYFAQEVSLSQQHTLTRCGN